MLDKAVELSRARTVSRRLSGILVDLGFEKQVGGKSVRVVDGHRWHVGIHKLRHLPEFRVQMSFALKGSDNWTVEISDKWTCRDSPAGRRFDFNIRWGDDAEERCLREIHDFVQIVAVPWFEAQAAATTS